MVAFVPRARRRDSRTRRWNTQTCTRGRHEGAAGKRQMSKLSSHWSAGDRQCGQWSQWHVEHAGTCGNLQDLCCKSCPAGGRCSVVSGIPASREQLGGPAKDGIDMNGRNGVCIFSNWQKHVATARNGRQWWHWCGTVWNGAANGQCRAALPSRRRGRCASRNGENGRKYLELHEGYGGGDVAMLRNWNDGNGSNCCCARV